MKKIIKYSLIISVIIIIFQNIIYATENKIQEQTKPNGIYKILVGIDASKAIEVMGADKSNNAIVDIWQFGNATQQKFYFEYQKEGYYKITAMHTGKSLTAKNNKIEEGTEIIQYDYQGLESQKWVLRDSKKNGWVISPLSNLDLSVSMDEEVKNGAKIVLSKTEDSENQMFYLFNISKEERTKPNGIYKIAVGKDASKAIEVMGADKSNNATVDIWQFGDAIQQKFYFEYQEDGYYKITAMHTGKSLTVKNNNIVAGSEVVQYDYQGLDSQKWILRDSKKNGWIISSLSNPDLSVSISNTIKNGAKIVLSKTEDNEKQMYYLFNISKEEQAKSNKVYKIAVGKDANKVIEVMGADKTNNAIIDIWDYGNADQQKFNFEYQEEGYYKITAVHTGKSLTVKNNNIAIGADIIQYDYQGLNSQKWLLRDSKKNGWIIYPLNNPQLCISISGKINNGAKLVLAKNEDNDNQMFYIMRGTDLNIKEGIYGKSGLMHKGTDGQYLKYYQIGKGNKHLFLNFAIHGFEDSYNYDGQELTYIANEFFSYLKNEVTDDLVEKWTVFILPSLNPDGEYNGWTNNGPGRTTLYSLAPNHKGIDMNRCFPVGYKSTNVNRNYNGNSPLQAYEAEALRDFILNNSGSQNIVIDIHGWLNETIGDNEIGKYYRNEYGIKNHIDTYGSGYLINWARSIPNTRSMLLELPEVKSHYQVVDNNYVKKFTNATMKLLRNF